MNTLLKIFLSVILFPFILLLGLVFGVSYTYYVLWTNPFDTNNLTNLEEE